MLTKFKSVRQLRPRSGYDVIAVIAMFAALGTGSAHAIGLITGAEIVDDTVASIDIKDTSVAGADVAPNTLTTTHIKDASVTGADVAPSTVTGTHVIESSLGKVPSATTADVAGDAYVKSLDYHNVAADETWRTYMTLNLPAGKYALTAKLPAVNWETNWALYCRLRLGGTELDTVIGSEDKARRMNLTLIAAGSLSAAGTASVECAQNLFPEYDGHIYKGKLMAVKVANVTQQP